MTETGAKTLGLSAICVLAIGWASLAPIAPLIVYNASPSLPIGFYGVTSLSGLRRGDVVVVAVPEDYQTLVTERQYLASGAALIKRVAALAGDHVCAANGAILINARLVAHTLKHDSSGRPMPVWTGCRRLQEGEFFALIAELEASFDSRYMGPLTTKAVVGRARPLWVIGP
jgi:conjugative transfer signal peptidase TraF